MNAMSAPYHLVVLSNNYFLWMGLKHSIPYMINPYPTLQWFNKVGENCIFELREKILQENDEIKWLVITEERRMQEVQQCLPPERVCVLSDKLSIKQLTEQLKHPEFRRTMRKETPLTPSEIHICLLIIMGFSPNSIARMLHKSPKTIYTHRRNAMAKFHCNTLADLHRKIRTIENRSLYQ